MDIFSKEMLYSSDGGGTPFVRPNLSSNGTLGGNAFAVTANASPPNAYKAVDGSASTVWSAYSSATYTFYNPTPLNVTKVLIKCYDRNRSISSATIQGSNDNSSWTTISSSYSLNSNTYVGTLTLNNNAFYKYYILSLTPYNSTIYLSELEIEAKER